MAEKWNTTIGSLSNQVAQDIPDIGENFDYLMARNGYLVDAGQTNQGAVGDGSGYTIKDIVDLVGATKKATIFLPHHAADGNTTSYALGTDETITDNFTLVIQPGAIIAIATGKTLTINGDIIAGPIQQLFSLTGTGKAAFPTRATVHANWWVTGGAGTSGDPWTGGDSAAGIKTACVSGAGVVKLVDGYYSTSTKISMNGMELSGEHVRNTIITSTVASGETLFVDGVGHNVNNLTIDCNETTGSIGIVVGGAYEAMWTGAVRVTEAATCGVRFDAATHGYSCYGEYGAIHVSTGNTVGSLGVDFIGGTGDNSFNANHWSRITVIDNTSSNTITGLQIDSSLVNNAAGNVIDFLSVEGGDVGVSILAGGNTHIVGGWLENNTGGNIVIDDDPTVGSFFYGGYSDNRAITYTYSNNKSFILPVASSYTFNLAGRWYFDHMEASSGGDNEILGGVYGSNKLKRNAFTDNAATQSAVDSGLMFFNYSVLTELTDLTSHQDNQIVVLMSNNTNVYIIDSGNFVLGSEKWEPAKAGDSITLLYESSTAKWTELSRSRAAAGRAALADSATPSVLDGPYFITGGTTTITNFTDGYALQKIYIRSDHAITITDNSNIVLSGGTNFIMKATDTLTLILYDDDKWYEFSRSVN